MRRQPDVPGHRPPHLQRLHEGLHLPEAGAGQHPADRDARPHRRARAAVGPRDLRPAHALEPAQRRAARTRARTTARTCSSSGSARPATRSRTTSPARASASSASTGSRSSRLPVELTGDGTQAPRADPATSTTLYGELDERILLGFGGVSEYGITVRWDKNFLTLLYLTLARNRHAPHVRRRPLRRHADASTTRGSSASTTSRSPRARAGPTHHRHEEQPRARHPQGERLPHGPAAHRRLQADVAREPAGAACPRSSSAAASPRSTRRPSCSPTTSCRSRRTLERFEMLVGERAGGGRRAAMFDDEEWADARASTSRTAARSATRRRDAASARAASRDVQRLLDSWGGVTLVYRKSAARTRPRTASTTRRSSRASRRACATSRTSRRPRRSSTTRGHVKAMRFAASSDGTTRRAARRARSASPRARARTSPTRRSTRARSSSTSGSSTSARTTAIVDAGGKVVARAGRRRAATGSSRATRRTGTTVSFYGDNHPHYAGSVVKAMASAQGRLPARRRRSSRRSRRSTAATQPARDATLARALREARRRARRDGRTRSTGSRRRSSRSSCARRWPRASSSRASSTACRTSRRTRPMRRRARRLAMEGLALTGAWVDAEKGLLGTIVLEMGGELAPLRGARSPASPIVAHGPDGRADRDRREGDGAALRRRPRQRRALLDRARVQGAGQHGPLLRRLQATARTSSSRTTSSATPTRSSGAPTAAPPSRRAARRTRTSAATSCRRWSPTATGELGGKPVASSPR